MSSQAKISREARTEPESEDLSEFRKILIERKDEILRQAVSIQAQVDQQQIVGGPGDEADLSQVDTNADYYMKLADTQRNELFEITRALNKWNRGTYGICENCAEEITVQRLSKIPHARLCLDCQSLVEARQKTMAPRMYPKL